MKTFMAALGLVAAGCGEDREAVQPDAGSPVAAQDAAPCTPKWCFELLANCGTVESGCGPETCGNCYNGTTCGGAGEPNVCAVPASEQTCVDGWCVEAPAFPSMLPCVAVTRIADDLFAGGDNLSIWHGGFVELYGSAYITAISGSGRDDLWALAQHSCGWLCHWETLEHFDGTKWRPPIDVSATGLYASGNDVVLVGYDIRHLVGNTWQVDRDDGVTWTAIAGAGGDVYALGTGASDGWPSRLARRRAGIWEDLPPPPTGAARGIAVVAPDDVWVVGNDYGIPSGGTVLHWNGVSWSKEMPPGAPSNASLSAVTVSGGEVWATGYGNPILHRSALGVWTSAPVPITGWLYSLATDATGRVWAGGEDGALLHRP